MERLEGLRMRENFFFELRIARVMLPLLVWYVHEGLAATITRHRRKSLHFDQLY